MSENVSTVNKDMRELVVGLYGTDVLDAKICTSLVRSDKL